MPKSIDQLAHEYHLQGHEQSQQRILTNTSLNSVKDAIEETYREYPEMLILTRKNGDYLEVLVVDGSKKNNGRTTDALMAFVDNLR